MGTVREDQHVVHLRVQVIDLRSFTLDVQVPTYLPVRDLTQRFARDAGLESHWPDGRRRLYWLRARGRLVRDDERLIDLGVVNGELVHLLPEPPPGSGVVEQVPDHPPNRGYLGKGLPALFLAMGVTMAWSLAWGVALAQERSLGVVTLPGFALGLLCSGIARHAWGGRGTQLRILVTAVALVLPITLAAFLSPKLAEWALDFPPVDLLRVYMEGIPGILLAVMGAMVGWLAWWGAAEPLPPAPRVQAAATVEAVAAASCGLCGQAVDAAVRYECPHSCGKVFHKGCWHARKAVYRGDAARCIVCGVSVVG